MPPTASPQASPSSPPTNPGPTPPPRPKDTHRGRLGRADAPAALPAAAAQPPAAPAAAARDLILVTAPILPAVPGLQL